MKTKSLSTLGYLMECLNIQTVALARFLLVDASLVSKWKTGVRPLSEKSVYLDDIVEYLYKQSEPSNHEELKIALRNLYPHEMELDTEKIKILLKKALTGTKSFSNLEKNKFYLME